MRVLTSIVAGFGYAIYSHIGTIKDLFTGAHKLVTPPTPVPTNPTPTNEVAKKVATVIANKPPSTLGVDIVTAHHGEGIWHVSNRVLEQIYGDKFTGLSTEAKNKILTHMTNYIQYNQVAEAHGYHRLVATAQQLVNKGLTQKEIYYFPKNLWDTHGYIGLKDGATIDKFRNVDFVKSITQDMIEKAQQFGGKAVKKSAKAVVKKVASAKVPQFVLGS